MVQGEAFCAGLPEKVLSGEGLSHQEALRVLDGDLPLLPLLQAAFRVREHHFGRGVRVHILKNAQNGYCPEDCTYCAQAAGSAAPIERYGLVEETELEEGAAKAWEAGAYRYCMVLSGRGPSLDRVRRMADLVRRLKARFPIQVCLSAGLIDREMALLLREAGLDRYNHNLNTAEGHYGRICTTHTYAQRLSTLEAAKGVGLEVCSGLIVGMGESSDDLLEVADTLRRLQARSIPVNFYVHVAGNRLGAQQGLTPERGLRVLCLFRFLNPDAEIRAAGGREANLRGLESLALYPANSLFAEGYLNTAGHGIERTLKLITDAGFQVDGPLHAD
ncbi:MAG: biotin synthase BioB [Magnetococcales bacterium]|nr:biotin synthase BioB [Magnetococcales bacterium]